MKPQLYVDVDVDVDVNVDVDVDVDVLDASAFNKRQSDAEIANALKK